MPELHTAPALSRFAAFFFEQFPFGHKFDSQYGACFPNNTDMFSFSAEVNTVVINSNGIVMLLICLASTHEHHKLSFLVAEDNTKLLTIVLDKTRFGL